MQVVKINNLTIKKSENFLFKDFNFSLQQGEKVGIFAPTGTGKSTLLNYIAQILPLKNDFEISGDLLTKNDLKISYVFQDLRLIENLTVFENVYLPLKNIYGKEKAKEIATEYINKFFLGPKINQKVFRLSGGEKQRVAISRAFSFPCHLLLLDEPFHSQDSEKKDFFLNFTQNFINQQNITLLMISHDKNELNFLCEKIIDETMFCCK